MGRFSTTYVYLAIVLGLLCYVAFIDKRIPGTREAEEAQTELFKFELADVTGLEIHNVHGLFLLKKENGHWEIKTPVNTPADGPTIDQILNEIAFAQPQRVIKIDGSNPRDQANLKEWGLAPSAERIVIHTKTKSFELLVGRKMAINDSVYARGSGRRNEPVRILPQEVKDILQKDLSSLRSRAVFDFDTDKVTHLATQIANTATTPAQECEINLRDGKWVLQKPIMARAAESDVQGLLGRVAGLRVVDFVNDDASNLSQYGLTAPVATLALTASPGDEQVLQVGGPVPDKPNEVYAHRVKSNSVFTLTRSVLDGVFKAVPNVRDRHILAFQPTRVTALAYTLGNKNVSLHSDKGVWSTTGPGAGPADTGKILDLLGKLSQLETTPVLKDSVSDFKAYGLDKPQGRITIEPTGGKPLTLIIGRAENKLLYVRNMAESSVYTLPDNTFVILPDNNLAFRDARAVNLPLDQVRGLTIAPAGEPAVVLTRTQGGTWTATNVKDRMVDSTRAEAQASLLCQLQATTWLGPVQPAYGLSKPALVITVLTDKPTAIRFGARMPDGGHVAQVEGTPTAFEIAEGDFGLLNASTLQSLPPALPATNKSAVSTPATNSTPAKATK